MLITTLASPETPLPGNDETTDLSDGSPPGGKEDGERLAGPAHLPMPAAETSEAGPVDPGGAADRRTSLFRAGRTGLVTPTGPLNGAAAAALVAQIRALTAACRSLILDLRRVEYVDSQGAKALLALRDAVAEAGGRLRLVITEGSPVERTLRLLRFDSLFPIFRRVTDAWRGKEKRAKIEGAKAHHGDTEARRGKTARRRGDH